VALSRAKGDALDEILLDALIERRGARIARGLRCVATRLTPLRLVVWVASGPVAGSWLDAAVAELSGRARPGLYRRRVARRRPWCR